MRYCTAPGPFRELISAILSRRLRLGEGCSGRGRHYLCTDGPRRASALPRACARREVGVAAGREVWRRGRVALLEREVAWGQAWADGGVGPTSSACTQRGGHGTRRAVGPQIWKSSFQGSARVSVGSRLRTVSSGSFIRTVALSGMLLVRKTDAPMTAPSPMTVSPPRTVALA